MYRRLFFLLEGDDDVRFFRTIVKPMFEREYDHIQLVAYAQSPPKVTRRLINSINAMSADYIFITDINNSPCITHRKQTRQNQYNNLDTGKLMVIRKEIESWYLSGLDDTCCRKLRIQHCNTTDGITKEQFDRMTPKKFEKSRIDFCQEILKWFDIETAKQKNGSFRYFINKYKLNWSYARSL